MQSLEICIIHFLFYRKFLQLRTSGSLCFHNSDVNTVFDISRTLYERNFEKTIQYTKKNQFQLNWDL